MKHVINKFFENFKIKFIFYQNEKLIKIIIFLEFGFNNLDKLYKNRISPSSSFQKILQCANPRVDTLYMSTNIFILMNIGSANFYL